MPSRHAISSAASAGSARDKVLTSALELFTRQGYFKTSMRDITRASAVSTGSVYHHFKDKEGVAAALYQDMIERMRSELLSIIAANDSAHDQCRAVVDLLFAITDAEPALMSFMLYARHREFLPNERPVCSSEPFELMRDMVARGMQCGEIRQGDVTVASVCLFGGAIRMITSHLDGVLTQPLADYLDELWTCSWRAVAA